ncbi:hypothetical protein Gferi_03315 [Geosporobacter ferrireducens]|uniref:Sigma-54-dependent Fis family transcriptional regulator n=1 Tax=Geosporobacter ferrireducens TaxID=1424294 RepID=A0A1D8GPV2_9FIRM|nr:hypothetical protein Gferi_03315 [Geosporobacter ferrireducens]
MEESKKLIKNNQELEVENKALKFKVNLMEDILDNMYEAVHAVDTEGKIILYSKPNEKYDIWKKEEVIGKYEIDLWEPPSDFLFDKEQIIKKGKPVKNIKMIGNSRIGKQFHIIAGFYPYFENEEYKAFYYTGRDITTLDSFIMQTYELQRKMSQTKLKKDLINGCKFTLNDIIGNSEAVRACKEKVRRIANYNANILIYGETGTGKELFAQGIHNESLYAHEPFIALNCSAVPETLIESLLFGTVRGAFTGAENIPGVFEQVGKGTLFLDEINSMPLSMQAKLLRVLQDKKIRRIGDTKDIDIECCVICATNMDPKEAVKKNIMREDFFYRIATVILTIPPLRERKEDIPLLIDYFIEKFNKKYGKYIKNLDANVMEYFVRCHWPGNVRELVNTLECAIMLCEEDQSTLTAELFPNYIYYARNRHLNIVEISEKSESSREYDSSYGNLNTLLDNYERNIIMSVINENKNNISAAAKKLGIDRKSLYRKMEKYNLR